MAEQMQDIKRRIKSISSTERITSAMRLVSASKFRKAKKSFDSSQEYLNRLLESIKATFDNKENIPKEFLKGSREIKTTCYIMITSSTGLCGSFNSNVIREVENQISKEDSNVKLVTIGTKGKEYFQRRGVEILTHYDSPADTVKFTEAIGMGQPLVEQYKKGEIDEINLTYTTYVNTLIQEVKTVKLLPFDPQNIISSLNKNKEIEYEPSAGEVFDYMVPKYVELMMFRGAIESATCEYGARRTAMENAHDNASDMLNQLSVYYNRARQANITDQIIEIVAGSEAQR